MAEKEHFTNGRTWTFGVGFGLMSLAFGAQIGGWQHWVSIGATYGTGAVFMLGSATLIAKSYFGWHQELPSGPSVGLPTLSAKPSRLKIISARYGVAGTSERDVTNYLLERLSGNSFAELVGGELFLGFDPVPGKPKRITVHYSFDGKDATIERCENELLVLPEDPRLGEALYESARSNMEYRGERDRCREEKRELQKRFDELFTPLQIEAFQLAKDIRAFLREMGDMPKLDPPADMTAETYPKYVQDRLKLTDPWLGKLSATFEADFAPKMRRIYLEFKKLGLSQGGLKSACDYVGDEKVAATIPKILVALAHQADE